MYQFNQIEETETGVCGEFSFFTPAPGALDKGFIATAFSLIGSSSRLQRL